MDTIIRQIAAEMERQNISKSRLAVEAGIGRPHIYRVMSGECSPTLEWLNKVGDVLGLSDLSFKKSTHRC